MCRCKPTSQALPLALPVLLLLLVPPFSLPHIFPLRFPELLQLMPHACIARLTPPLLLTCPPPEFNGRLARLSVHLEELLLPGGSGGSDQAPQRPRMEAYSATYSLPGGSSVCVHVCVCMCVSVCVCVCMFVSLSVSVCVMP
jgi:hypothetical protein